MKKYNFDQLIDRTNTCSFKWDNVTYPASGMLPMPVADMDFPVAEEILATLNRLTSHAVLGYAIVPDALKLAAQAKLLQSYGWETELDWQVWIPGIVPGIAAACAAFTSPQDGILTAVPVYHPFHLVADWVDRPLFTFPMVQSGNRWTYDFEAFEEALKKGPKVFLFCNPHNPGGTVFNNAEIERIRELCAHYNCLIVSDEIHADLPIRPQSTHHCIKSEINFFATSKAYNTAGLAGAFAIIPDKKIRDAFIKKTNGFFPMLTRHSIEVMHTSLTMSSDWLDSLLPYLRANHDFLLESVNALPGLEMLPLEATYLAWISFDPAMHGDFQKRLFEAGLHVLRGEQFKGGHFIRLNFACPRVHLEKAISIIQDVVYAGA